MNKRGLSEVIASVIMIGVVLVAIGIIGIVIKNIATQGAAEISIESYNLKLKISNVRINSYENQVSINVKRNAGAGDIKKLKFIFYNSSEIEINEITIEIKELETKTFNINLQMNVTNLTKVSLTPILILDSRSNSIGTITLEYAIQSSDFFSAQNSIEDSADITTDNRFGGDLLLYGVLSDRTDQTTLDAFSNTFSDLGLGIVRFDIYWGKIEISKDNYDWSTIDTLLTTVPDKEILFTVYSTSEWGSSYNDCRRLIEQTGGLGKNFLDNRPPSSPPQNINDYLSFIDVLVNKYKGQVKYWQIENEIYGAKNQLAGCPDVNSFWIGTSQEYVDYLNAVYDKIKSIDNSLTVLASSYAFRPDFNDFNDFYKQVLNEGKTDVWDFHFYSSYTKDEYKIDKLRDYPKNQDIWVSESGEIDSDFHTEYADNMDSPDELKLQAEELVKRFAIDFSAGVKKIFKLRLNKYSNSEPATVNWNHMGFTFDKEGTNKKPSYYTFKIIGEKLHDFSNAEKITDNIYKFSFASKPPVYILWNDAGNINIDLSYDPDISSEVNVTNIITVAGQINPDTIIRDSNSIPINSTPIFVENINL